MLELKKYKKSIFILISVFILIGFAFQLSACSAFTSEEKILTSTSPDNTYTLEAYRVNGGATTDYSIKVYRIDNDSSKSLIYNKYHDYNAEIKWISNYTVSINDVTIDLSKNETYDWRNK